MSGTQIIGIVLFVIVLIALGVSIGRDRSRG